MKRLLSLATAIILSVATACSKHEDSSAADGSGATTVQTSVNTPNLRTSAKQAQAIDGDEPSQYTEVSWTDLLPDDDLQALENPPDYLDDIEDGSDKDALTSRLKAKSSPAEDRYQQALNSKQVRPEFNGSAVRIPGFIVPLEFNDQQTITTFFLVPFFGACIHMPPPPPNQILYAEYEPGIRLDALYDPFWINGTLSTILVENDMATAAYSIDVSAIEPYVETSHQQWSDPETP